MTDHVIHLPLAVAEAQLALREFRRAVIRQAGNGGAAELWDLATRLAVAG